MLKNFLKFINYAIGEIKDFFKDTNKGVVFGFIFFIMICWNIKTDYRHINPQKTKYTLKLEEENQKLKDKIENIHQIASDRSSDYSEILDNIEAESSI